MTAKYGTPYFSNYVNSDMDPSDIRSMCCRLRLDLRELRHKNGGFFGAGESTGSIGVVTLNLPKIAYLSDTEDEFWQRLDKLMDLAAKSLDIKRKVVTEWFDKGLYPYTKAYLPNGFVNHFSTIGLVGGNEMCLNAKWLQKDLTDPEAQKFTEKVLDHMRERLADYQEMYAPAFFNLEATPAESTSYRLAKHDKEMFPDIITAGGNGDPYYTNSTNLPVGATDDVFDALDVQDRLQTKYTSGTVFHTFIGEKLPSWESAAKLVRTITDNYKLPYISISPTYSICPEHGYIAGEKKICPLCGKMTEVYSRITGYYRPLQNWNAGKTSEFAERKTYDMSGAYRHRGEDVKDEREALPFEEKVPEVEEHCASCQMPKAAPEIVSENISVREDHPVLFKTDTCPNCKLVMKKLMDAGIEYDAVSCTAHPELAVKYDIHRAPTLLDHGKKYSGPGEILQWIKANEVREV